MAGHQPPQPATHHHHHHHQQRNVHAASATNARPIATTDSVSSHSNESNTATATAASKSWTDDLPVCHDSAIGSSNNARYRADGSRPEAHAHTDRSIHCRIDEHTSIYAVFSSLGGSAAVAEAALQCVAAEILLGQLADRRTDEEVRDVLRQAFVAVERGYADSIDLMLAKKAMLQCELEGITQYEISRQYQAIVDQLNYINRELAVGASVVLALIHRARLYICNVGSCRALLCRNDANGVLRVIQLSVEHNLHNEDEVLRLSQMGLDVETVGQTPFFTTRCIGAYAGKAGYRDCTYLSAASAEPIASEPEIVGAIPLDDSCRFLLLMSGGLCRTLYDIVAEPDSSRTSGSPTAVTAPSAGGDEASGEIVIATNKEIVQLAVDEFRVQSTLSGVAQASANQVVQRHHDCYMRRVQQYDDEGVRLQERDDITLLVRNFNFPMPNAIQRRGAVAAAAANQGTLLAGAAESAAAAAAEASAHGADVPDYFPTNSSEGHSGLDTNSSTNSLVFRMERDRKFDKNYRIKPYVDFTEFNRRFEAAKDRGQLPDRMQPILTTPAS